MQGFPELFEDTSEKKERERKEDKEDEPSKEEDTKGGESPPLGSEK